MIFKAKLMWLFGVPFGLVALWFSYFVVIGVFQGCSEWVSGFGQGDEEVDQTPEVIWPIHFYPDQKDKPREEQSLLEGFSDGMWRFHFYEETPRDLKLLRERSTENQVVLRARYIYLDQYSRRDHTYEILLTLTQLEPGKVSMEMVRNLLATHDNIADMDGSFRNKKFLNSYTGTGVRGKSYNPDRPAWKINYHHQQKGPNGRVTYKTDAEGYFVLMRSW